MKNILFLSTIYPTPEWEDTPVCHYFTKEWVKMGYNVKVIHYQSIFPVFFYWALALFPKLASRYIGNDKNSTKRRTKDIHFVLDGVTVYSFPIFKFIPHGKYMKITINKQLKKILRMNELDDFIPDSIIGHFYNPQIEIISKLKEFYPKTRTCIVLHEKATIIGQTYSKNHYSIINNIDIWGFRSNNLRNDFINIYGKDKNDFICYSGVPEHYISTRNGRDFSGNLRKFIYVGQLIERKYPSVIIHAINNVNAGRKYHLTFIGTGYLDFEIKNTTKSLNINENISLTGEVTRDKILKYLDESDMFVMIARDEVFGLAYLEAMARGCITIGSRNEGIDGVIQHGINGFLCDAGNKEELENLLRHIDSLSSKELIRISENAIETAKEMTDYKVAEKYINAVVGR